MMVSLDRHFKNKGCFLSIVREREFSSSKEMLEDKAKQIRLLTVISAQTNLGKYQRKKTKFSGRAENSDVITQNLTIP